MRNTRLAEQDSGRRSLRRVVAASLVGTVIEWYDFFLYGTAAALVFNRVFFPQSEPLIFIARPVGGVIFGHFGDRIGRKQLLMLSLVLMGIATFAIGLLPYVRADRRVGPRAKRRTFEEIDAL